MRHIQVNIYLKNIIAFNYLHNFQLNYKFLVN